MSGVDSDDVRRLLDSIDSGDHRLVSSVDVLETIRGLAAEAFSNHDELHDRQVRIQEIYAQVPEEGELDEIIGKVNALAKMGKREILDNLKHLLELLEAKNLEFARAHEEAAQYYNA